MGILYIVSTPIGNLEDITIRALRIIFTTSIILCEDTRKTGMLLSLLKKQYASIISSCHSCEHLFSYNNEKKNPEENNIKIQSSNIKSSSNDKFQKSVFNNPTIQPSNIPQLIRFDEFTEKYKLPEIIYLLKSGQNIALVSDAGTPLISDPGYELVMECRKRNITVIPIPGPTAFVAALSASGLPSDTVCFFGYPPEKSGKRIQKFEVIKQMADIQPLTAIFYCAPHKLNFILKDLDTVFKKHSIVIVRELTKIHESIWSGPISQALEIQKEFKGEIVVLLYIHHQ